MKHQLLLALFANCLTAAAARDIVVENEALRLTLSPQGTVTVRVNGTSYTSLAFYGDPGEYSVIVTPPQNFPDGS